jgi:multidrug efflux pump subunit AcrB
MADLNGRSLTIGSFGLVLVVATAAAQIRRRAVGTAVFGGVIAAISIGFFLVPMLYTSSGASASASRLD